jgi:hypothetical protein
MLFTQTHPMTKKITSIFLFLSLTLFFFSTVNGQPRDILSGEPQSAARMGNLEYFTTLLDVVDDPITFLNHQEQSTEQTPLVAAALAGQAEIVKQLLETGVDVTIPEKTGSRSCTQRRFKGERKS